VETLYDRLGVPRDVDGDDLRRAWKRIVRTVHPDAGGDTVAFQELEKAYDVLSHPNTRAFYDLALDTYRPGASLQPVPTKAAVPPPEWFADLGGTTVLPSSGRRPRRHPAPAPPPVEEDDEPTGRHEAGAEAQPSDGRRTTGIGKRLGSTWKRARAVRVETTRS
jgi:hypothetical protein